jgi:fructokinase
VITRVGDDSLGREVLGHFDHWGIDRSVVQVDPDRPTGRASVALSGDGVPQFVIDANAAWDYLSATREALAAVREADAICFGSLAQRSPPGAAAVQRLVAAASYPTLRIFDINLRQNFRDQEVVTRSLTMADVLKLNDQELPVLAQLFALTGSARQQLEQMAERFDLQLVALTRGGQGSLLYQAGNWSDRGTEAVEIVDTVGAGDAFTAALAMGLLGRMELEHLHALAAELAGYVCTRSGATPPLPDHFRAAFAPPAMKTGA